MKNIVLLIFVSCFSCQETKNSETSNPGITTESKTTETVEVCFISTGPDIPRENKTLRDSTILNLTIQGRKATGTYFWLPAEKDSRRGTLKAQKDENLITGKYTFMQEGKQETQPILIQLKENAATITTNKNLQGEMTLEVEEIACSD